MDTSNAEIENKIFHVKCWHIRQYNLFLHLCEIGQTEMQKQIIRQYNLFLHLCEIGQTEMHEIDGNVNHKVHFWGWAVMHYLLSENPLTYDVWTHHEAIKSQQTLHIGPTSVRYWLLYRSDIGFLHRSDVGCAIKLRRRTGRVISTNLGCYKSNAQGQNHPPAEIQGMHRLHYCVEFGILSVCAGTFPRFSSRHTFHRGWVSHNSFVTVR